MDKVTFYILSTNTQAAYINFLCRFVQKAHQQSQKIFIFSQDQDFLNLLDEQLWIFNPNAFLAHDLIIQAHELADIKASIVLSDCVPSPEQLENARFSPDIVINLATDTPLWQQQFQRGIELIDQDPIRLEQGRVKYKRYEQMQVLLETHKIK